MHKKPLGFLRLGVAGQDQVSSVGTVKQFEDLPVWRAGRELVKRIYGITRSEPARQDPGFCDQIQRAAVSVPSNIAEGHERSSTPDLINYLFIAKGSAGEVRSQLYNVEDIGYASPADAADLRERCFDLSRQLSAWIQSMQTPGFKGGPKFHKEPDRSLGHLFESHGLKRQPDGRYLMAKESRVEYGAGEDGKRKDGKRKTGKTEYRKRKSGKRKA